MTVHCKYDRKALFTFYLSKSQWLSTLRERGGRGVSRRGHSRRGGRDEWTLVLRLWREFSLWTWQEMWGPRRTPRRYPQHPHTSSSFTAYYAWYLYYVVCGCHQLRSQNNSSSFQPFIMRVKGTKNNLIQMCLFGWTANSRASTMNANDWSAEDSWS